MEHFDHIYRRACERHGGEAALRQRIATPLLTPSELAAIPDDRWLSSFTMSLFQSGFVWQVIRNKWPEFERAFFGFAPEKMLLLDEQHLARLNNDEGIVRHAKKIAAVPVNARMVLELGREHGGFGAFVAQWPQDDITGLWQQIKGNGQLLGGNIAAYGLRRLGVDTFVFTHDVSAYLRHHQVISAGLGSKKGMAEAQAAFNEWRRQSGRSFSEISKTVACSIG
ncbi:DNA-3-methyladenine glycosylase I [Oceanisphaera psychrotolerans]|uniref:3-methyladenine DNA glycosylase n=1 Tax=Oceanisphaera psychrotolerans TaxID=1414654 RepID=A0A1J4QHH4_9GAMM|nr:DNA-3-methyladenine glycosylase I [Oceanisphaera psychrotolerans]OIN10426.1 3-methyladenine DNA glycosylase [Oceanisphaera psychrotolerans]